MNKEENKKLQERYDNLSLEERNAYEQIVERHTSKSSILSLPYVFVEMMIVSGLLFIIVSIITNTPIDMFREAYLGIMFLMIILVYAGIFLGLVFKIIETYKINKLKRKLLSN